MSLLTESLGVVANISSNIAFIPQIIKTYRRKRVKDISMTMFLILFLTQVCWIIYAIPLQATELWISSSIEIVLLIPLFIMWGFYRKNSSH